MVLLSSQSMHPTLCFPFFFFNDTATTEIYTLSLHDALPICDLLAGAQHDDPPRQVHQRPHDVLDHEQRDALALSRRISAMALSLATSPRLLLLDEFMAGLNPAETESAMALIRRLQGEGVTLLMVEHIVWALMDLSRRIIVLSAGEKIAEGPPDAIAADPTVIEVYLGGAGGSARRA